MAETTPWDEVSQCFVCFGKKGQRCYKLQGSKSKKERIVDKIEQLLPETTKIAELLTENADVAICESCLRKLNVSYSFQSTLMNRLEEMSIEKLKKIPPSRRSVIKMNTGGGSRYLKDHKDTRLESSEEESSSDEMDNKDLCREHGEENSEQLLDIDAYHHSDHTDNMNSYLEKQDFYSNHFVEQDFNDKTLVLKMKEKSSLNDLESCGKEKQELVASEEGSQCSLCGKVYKNRSGLFNHMKSAHGERKLPCEICKKTFFTKSGLQDHMVSHMDVSLYLCPTCGKGYRSRGALSNHKMSHTYEGFMCKTCNKSFPSLNQLKTHRQEHNSMTMKQKCPKCGVEFKDIEKHLYVCVANYAKHECQVCGRVFKLKRYLAEHYKYKHKETANFICYHCGKSFDYRSSLRVHLKRCKHQSL